jgi:hypothetical protein
VIYKQKTPLENTTLAKVMQKKQTPSLQNINNVVKNILHGKVDLLKNT